MPYPDLFRLAVDASACGIVIFDEAGSILFNNPTFGRLFGYPSEELVGSSIESLVPQRLRIRHKALREQFGKQGATRQMGVGRRVEGRRKDGTVFPVDVALMVGTHEGHDVVVASVMDSAVRRGFEDDLVSRQEFEQMVADIAAGFVSPDDAELNQRILTSLRQLTEMLGAERSSVWQRSGDDFIYTHLWLDPEATVPPPPPARGFASRQHFPWVMDRMEEGTTVAFADVDEVPSEKDRESLRLVGTKSSVIVPLTVGERLIGILTFGMVTQERLWSVYSLERLPLVAAVFANSLARKQANDELQTALVEVQRLKDQLAAENVQLRREVSTLKGPRVLATESPAARQVLAQIEQVAPTTATVLMLGETGSGKEVFAEALHQLSPRRNKTMVRVNCAAIPTALIESELFGRERGAYTGALSRQLGRFEVADGSTIFLDEVGELPLEVQVKLLRVLQDHIVERLGSTQQIKVNVRVIAATNRDLDQAVADRSFREDLYYRLNVFPIRIPALRDRVEDIPSLVWSFINEFSSAFGKNIESLSKGSLQALLAYSWPGNVRELRNVVERAMIIATGPNLVIELPRPTSFNKRKSLRFVDIEVDHIRSVLESTGWRIRGRGGAAELLGLKPTTLESRMAKLGIARAVKHNKGPGVRHSE
jgi:formate hydrogenlyase transcriptional activator